MNELMTQNLLDLTKTIVGDKLRLLPFPWMALEHIGSWVKELGPTLGYEERSPGVWIAPDVEVAATATILPPCIIGPKTEVRPGAYIRGNVLVGSGCVVGNSTELKNVILFDGVQVPHYNYVGDSILGYKAHMGAGSITSNVKADRSEVCVHTGEAGDLPTGRRKFGAILGDFAEIGCNAVLNPGSVVCRSSVVYPLTCLRGVVRENKICRHDMTMKDKINVDE